MMKRLRFLLLEDSLLDAELAQANLLEGGVDCDLVRVESRSDFLAALETELFDLILADYTLPSFDGISALKIAQARYPTIPFIFVSASLGEELAIEALKSGATDYVVKQRLERLTPCVQRALREARERRELQEAEAELKQTLQREKAARAEAEAANRVKDEFLAVLSHELRTPLNLILGWSKLLRTKKHDEATVDRALETIERNATLQTQLIEDLLDVSRILRGKLSLTTGAIDLAFIIKAALETVQLAADAKSIEIRYETDAVNLEASEDPSPHRQAEASYTPPLSPFLVWGDSSRLQQVVWNLLSNAVKFTPEGGRVEVRLENYEFSVMNSELSEPIQNSKLKTQNLRNYAQITITDTGKGIRSNFLPYVFDYFRQADGSTTRMFGGLGLGLAIVRHLVELHGGTVWAASPGEGQGATFTVKLPLLGKREPEINSQEDASHSRFPTADSPLAGVQVLVVDDDADARNFLIFALEQYGASTTSVSSAEAALTALDQFKPSVLISDVGMPIEDGYSLLRRVRSLDANHGGNTPAIALTAYASETDRQQAIAAGFQQHLSKPIDPEALVRAIVTLIEHNEAKGL